MTVGQALERAEELRPGSRVSVHTRQEWLREADGMLRERFFKASDTDAFDTVGGGPGLGRWPAGRGCAAGPGPLLMPCTRITCAP